MFSTVFLIAVWAALHFGLHLPVVIAAVVAVVVWAIFRILWMFRYFIAGIIGLEMLFGERDQ